MNNQIEKTPNVVILIVLVTMSIFLIAGTIFFNGRLIGFPIITVAAVCVILALVFTVLLRRSFRRMTGVASAIINYMLSIVAFSSLFTFCVMVANDVYCSHGEGRCHKAVVTGRERLKRSNTRRVGKRYVPDGTYHFVYQVSVAVEADTITFTVPQERYARLRRGTTVDVTIRPALWGSSRVEL